MVFLHRSAEFILSIVEWARDKPDLRNLLDAIGELCGRFLRRNTQNSERSTANPELSKVQDRYYTKNPP